MHCRAIWKRLTIAAVVSFMGSAAFAAGAPDETPPTTPPSFTATAVSATQINLSWGTSTDNKAVTGYNLWRCVGTSCTTIFTAFPSEHSFSDTGRTSGVTYNYEIDAFDAAGNQSDHAFASATTPDNVAPSTPTGLTATAASGTQINLSWSASTDNVGVTGYQVDRCTDAACSSPTLAGSPTTTTFSDTGRSQATTYWYRVRAKDAANNLSGNSTTASATTFDTQAPTAPSSLSATAASSTQINLSWTGSTDNVGVTAYLLERCADAACSSPTTIAPQTATTYSDTGLSQATSYWYRVRARDAANNLSGYSNTAGTTTLDVTAPSAPAALTATAVSGTQINLSWSASTDNVTVTGYPVDRCMDAACSSPTLIGTPTATTFSDTGRTQATTYWYRVRAKDAANNTSGNSNTASATTFDTQAPTTPTGVSATGVSSTQVNLTWTASTDNVGVTGYSIEKCAGSGCTSGWTPAGTSGTASFSSTGLSPTTTYGLRVTASDAASNASSPSGIAYATTSAPPDTQAPTAPSGLTATPGGHQITLSWTAATDNVGVTGYLIDRCTGTSCTPTSLAGPVAGLAYVDSTAGTFTTYRYQVRARDDAGNVGPASSIASSDAVECD